jgi:CheY-like chemotaxis protein
MMGGWIEVQSEPEKGCVFTFCIRVMPGRKPLRNALHPGMSALRGKRILVVDDNAVARGLLARQLQQWEAEAATAGSGREALNALSVETFDLVITDAVMPGMNGQALKKQIREQYPNINVIMPVKPVKQHILRDQLLHLFYSSASGLQPAKNNGEKLLEDFSQRHPLRILVAEDNPINQKLVLRTLGKLGYQPKMTANGKEVLEELSQNRYDLVLMDVQMPEMDGLEATRMIRLCLESQPIIIAMTANAMQGDRDLCLQAGMDDYISKPIELDDLLAQLEKWSTIRKNT